MGISIEMIKKKISKCLLNQITLNLPRGRNINPNTLYGIKRSVVELRKTCTRHGIKCMHVFKNLN